MNFRKTPTPEALFDERDDIVAAYDAQMENFRDRVEDRKTDVASRLAELEREQRGLNALSATLPV